VITVVVAAYGELTAFLVLSGAEPAAGREFQVAWALIILCVEVVLRGAAARAALRSVGALALRCLRWATSLFRRWPAEAEAA
jgi:hypothetical protein